MKFEDDSKNSQMNHDKHGIDFSTAQALWDDPNCIEFPLKTVDEPRYLVIGKIKNKNWSAIITYRNGNIRLI